jgi:peptidoglycan-associated lipoprotein
MSRLAVSPAIIAFFAVAFLAACTRGQSDYGLNAAKLGEATGAGSESGPITPGSMREFSTRAGDTVYYSTDSTSLSNEAQSTLIAQAQWLGRYAHYSILIEGHADERGTREYNIALGAQRAAGVRHFLLSRGIDPRRIRIISYGKERPVAVCANISCWSKNRRAVTVLDQGKIAAR